MSTEQPTHDARPSGPEPATSEPLAQPLRTEVVASTAWAPGRSGFAEVRQLWRSAVVAVLQGDPARATEVVDGAARGTPSRRWLWVVSGLLNGLVLGISFAILMARTSSQLGSWFRPSGGDYVAAVLVPVLLSFAYLLSRAGVMVGLFALRGRSISFTRSANLVSITYLASLPAIGAALLFGLIPGYLMAFVLTLALVFTFLYAEIVLYIAIARTGRFERSVALPHALLTSGWVVVVTFIAVRLVGDSLSQVSGLLPLLGR